LAQAGIELSGLSIREIGGSLPAGGAAAAAAAAASAYARSADGASAPEAADDSFDWDMQ
ncbi:flagellar hook-length control protein FliK, partial [Paraburkholderia bengalensis]